MSNRGMKYIFVLYDYDGISDILSKHWGYQNSYDLLLKSIFHHIGNVGSLIDHVVLRYNEHMYDPIKYPIVYLHSKRWGVLKPVNFSAHGVNQASHSVQECWYDIRIMSGRTRSLLLTRVDC